MRDKIVGVKGKFVFFVLLFVIIFSFSACDSTKGNDYVKDNKNTQTSSGNELVDSKKTVSDKSDDKLKVDAKKKAKQQEEKLKKQKLEEEKAKKKEEEQRKKQAKIDELIKQADYMSSSYFYDEAIEGLSSSKLASEEQIVKKIAEIKAKKDELVPYEGDIYHVFFHSLIVFNDKAFDNVGHSAHGYNLWMTTQSEFKKMLPAFLDRGYVLYPINKIVQFDENGNAKRGNIYLPKGKKPLIISIDDVSYYDYMKGDGFANRLVVNDNNEVVTEVKQPDGSFKQTKDGDVMPILDEFVKAHPEFSYRGYKGIVAPTGFQGIFGYRITDLEDYSDSEVAQMEKNVKAVVKRLKETGWDMATHSYTHGRYFSDGSITVNELANEIHRWKKKVTPYIGETNIFISPFGMGLDKNDPRLKLLVKEGFNIYCPVGANMKTSYYNGAMVQNRLNLDGVTLLLKPERAEMFFDAKDIVDGDRPKMK